MWEKLEKMQRRYKPESLSLVRGQSFTRKWNLNLSTADNLLAVKVCVAFRSKHPAEATMKDVLKELQDNNIDVSKLAISRTNHCQKEESSKAGRISVYR